MHLHAWNSPPEKPLTRNDSFYQPYLVEYDNEVMLAKIKELMEDEETHKYNVTVLEEEVKMLKLKLKKAKEKI